MAVKWRFSEMLAFHERTFAPLLSAPPAAGHIAASLLFARGPVTLQPSFAPRWGPLHHCSEAGALRVWHTHHTTDIMSARPSHRPQVWARDGAGSTRKYFYCTFHMVLPGVGGFSSIELGSANADFFFFYLIWCSFVLFFLLL